MTSSRIFFAKIPHYNSGFFLQDTTQHKRRRRKNPETRIFNPGMAASIDSAVDYSETGGVYYPLLKCWKWTNEDGLLHRDGDEPAMIEDNGCKYWYKNGYLHRDDGPAWTHPNGSFIWYCNNVVHRLTGKATYFTHTGASVWVIAGEEYDTQEEFLAARDKYYEDHDIVMPGRSTKCASRA